MKCIERNLGILKPKYPIENFCIPGQTLFIDIETTGLHTRSSNLYMIGCAYFDETAPCAWKSIQWLADNYDDEINILKAFKEFAAKYRYLIHFNGNRFDIPYLTNKFEEYNIRFNFGDYEGIDLYRRLSPYKELMHLPDCRQKTIEGYVNNIREDEYSGRELIETYHDYVISHDEKNERLLLLHNLDDIKGMFEIVAALAIPDLFTNPVKVTKVRANHYQNIDQEQCSEIVMRLKLESCLPVEISFCTNNCYFTGYENEGKLRVPLYEEEMKYFYSNYKDYYYLPVEDIAIHKSVSAAVAKEYREQAKASNCYTRKYSSYLPQWGALFTPFFKRAYNDKELFFELTDELKTNKEAFNLYAHHVLEAMIFA